MTNETEHREKEIIRITLIGSIVNGLLIVLKLAAGILAHSSAMIADGVHSLSDGMSDFVVIIMLRISGKPMEVCGAVVQRFTVSSMVRNLYHPDGLLLQRQLSVFCRKKHSINTPL